MLDDLTYRRPLMRLLLQHSFNDQLQMIAKLTRDGFVLAREDSLNEMAEAVVRGGERRVQ